MSKVLLKYKPGDRFEKWVVAGKLGEGAMGDVYEVKHRVTHKRGALKVLKPGNKKQAVFAEKFIQEARLLATQQHDGLADVYDAGDGSDGKPTWMVMELLVGRDLAKVIYEEGALPLERALDFAIQVALAAAVAHTAGVVHRDLKPGNIHVSDTDQVKVIDFGASKFKKKVRTHGGVLGSIPYMSPEQLMGRELDGRSDVYALGHILYVMLSGKHIYMKPDGNWLPQQQVMANIMSPEPISTFLDVDERVRPVLLRALEKTRERRYPSMEAFAGEMLEVRKKVGPTYYPTELLTQESVAAAASTEITGQHSFQTASMSDSRADAARRATAPLSTAAAAATAQPITSPAATSNGAPTFALSAVAIVTLLAGVGLGGVFVASRGSQQPAAAAMPILPEVTGTASSEAPSGAGTTEATASAPAVSASTTPTATVTSPPPVIQTKPTPAKGLPREAELPW